MEHNCTVIEATLQHTNERRCLMLRTHRLADFIVFLHTAEGYHSLHLHFHPQRPESKKKGGKEERNAENMVNLVKNCPFLLLLTVTRLTDHSMLLCKATKKSASKTQSLVAFVISTNTFLIITITVNRL